MPLVLSQGFRPFFLAAGVWSAVAVTAWIAVLALGTTLPSRFDPLSWHIHEMLFGFVMAAIAGFLLTAIPNWTQRRPVDGPLLGLLLALWLLGRLACLVSALMPSWFAVVADLSFPVILIGVVGREIIAARNWRNLPMVASLVLLGAANLLMHLNAEGIPIPFGLGWRLGLAAVLLLLSVVSGRIVPAFTRNWLARSGARELPAEHGLIDRIALGTLHAGLLGWVFLPDFRPTGLMLLLAASLNLWRLLRWRGHATVVEPMLVVLHVGYAWLVLGTVLLGLALLDLGPSESSAIHTLTVGAIGTMVLAMMTRVTRGHTGRVLSADHRTSVIYLLITIAAITRVAAAFNGAWAMPLLTISALLWISAFVAFLLCYGPFLLFPYESNRTA